MFQYEYFYFILLAIQLLITFAVLIAATYYDLKKGIIPIEVTMPLCLLGFVTSILPQTMINIILAACFLVIATPLYYKNYLGGGDIKLLIGVLLFTPVVFIVPEFYILFGLLTGIAGLVLYVLFKYVLKQEALVEKATLRFAPAILIGWTITAIVIIMGLL